MMAEKRKTSSLSSLRDDNLKKKSILKAGDQYRDFFPGAKRQADDPQDEFKPATTAPADETESQMPAGPVSPKPDTDSVELQGSQKTDSNFNTETPTDSQTDKQTPKPHEESPAIPAVLEKLPGEIPVEEINTGTDSSTQGGKLDNPMTEISVVPGSEASHDAYPGVLHGPAENEVPILEAEGKHNESTEEIAQGGVDSHKMPVHLPANPFKMTRSYNTHKLAKFLIDNNEKLDDEVLTLASLASLTGIVPASLRLSLNDLITAEILSLTGDGRSGGIKIDITDTMLVFFQEVYGNSFPKNKEAFRDFHKNRLNKLVKK